MNTMLQKIIDFYDELEIDSGLIIIYSCGDFTTKIKKTDSIVPNGDILVITREDGRITALNSNYIIKVNLHDRWFK